MFFQHSPQSINNVCVSNFKQPFHRALIKNKSRNVIGHRKDTDLCNKFKVWKHRSFRMEAGNLLLESDFFTASGFLEFSSALFSWVEILYREYIYFELLKYFVLTHYIGWICIRWIVDMTSTLVSYVLSHGSLISFMWKCTWIHSRVRRCHHF